VLEGSHSGCLATCFAWILHYLETDKTGRSVSASASASASALNSDSKSIPTLYQRQLCLTNNSILMTDGLEAGTSS
jgi:hypothetical protein